jgi:TonB family protein
MRAALLLFLLLPGGAFAQPAAPPPAPVTTRFVTSCDPWYPASQAKADGTSLLNIRIAADGTIHDPVLVAKSGTDFDAAALECAPHLTMLPILVGGAPAEVGWQIEILWREGHSFYNIPNSADMSACVYPRAATREHRGGDNTVAYTIEGDGSVTNVTLTQSSGSEDLDDLAVACAGARRYAPPTVGGKPARVQWHARFEWRLAPVQYVPPPRP